MSMSDPVADLLTVFVMVNRLKKVSNSPTSNMRENVLGVLEREGYIRGFERYNVRTGIDELRLNLNIMMGNP